VATPADPAAVTAADVAAAARWWKAVVPPEYRGLVDGPAAFAAAPVALHAEAWAAPAVDFRGADDHDHPRVG
jgi:hypothetical protein